MRKITLIIILLCGIAGPVRSQVNKHYFVWVGRDMVMDNRYREAIETLNILLRADPDAYEGYFWRGIAKYSLNDLLGAEQDFTSTIDKNPVYTNAYQFRALTRSRLGNYDDAFRDFKEAIELRPDFQAPYYSRGVAYIITHQYPNAVKDFDTYLRFNPRSADAYANRGVAYLNLRDTTAAMDDFNRTIRTNRDYSRGYAERGALYLAQQNFDSAVQDFDSAIKCDSTHTASYFNRAIAYHGKNNLRSALKDLDKVIELDPASSVAYFNRALLRTETGDYNRALEDYDKVALYSPGNVLVYYNRGILYRMLGELKPALKDYDRAIELLPDFASAYINRAEVKYLLKDVKGSAKDRATAQRKIASYLSRRNEDSVSEYADTSRSFNTLLSFDTRMSTVAVRNINTGEQEKITLRPMYKFTLRNAAADTPKQPDRYDRKRLDDYIASLGDSRIVFSPEGTNLSANALLREDSIIMEAVGRRFDKSKQLMRRSITQSLLRQYTNAISSLSSAIELDPTNPFLYLNLGAVRAEMTDFISSMDGEYVRISLESDRQQHRSESYIRTYDYDEAINDLNKAAKLYPELGHIYYNRGNLLALSGNFTSAYEDYTRAITLNPAFGDAYFNRGLVRIYMKEMRDGLLDMSKAGEFGIDEAYTVLKIYSPETK